MISFPVSLSFSAHRAKGPSLPEFLTFPKRKQTHTRRKLSNPSACCAICDLQQHLLYNRRARKCYVHSRLRQEYLRKPRFPPRSVDATCSNRPAVPHYGNSTQIFPTAKSYRSRKPMVAKRPNPIAPPHPGSMRRSVEKCSS